MWGDRADDDADEVANHATGRIASATVKTGEIRRFGNFVVCDDIGILAAPAASMVPSVRYWPVDRITPAKALPGSGAHSVLPSSASAQVRDHDAEPRLRKRSVIESETAEERTAEARNDR